jgi:hypothetical protein
MRKENQKQRNRFLEKKSRLPSERGSKKRSFRHWEETSSFYCTSHVLLLVHLSTLADCRARLPAMLAGCRGSCLHRER